MSMPITTHTPVTAVLYTEQLAECDRKIQAAVRKIAALEKEGYRGQALVPAKRLEKEVYITMDNELKAERTLVNLALAHYTAHLATIAAKQKADKEAGDKKRAAKLAASRAKRAAKKAA